MIYTVLAIATEMVPAAKDASIPSRSPPSSLQPAKLSSNHPRLLIKMSSMKVARNGRRIW